MADRLRAARRFAVVGVLTTAGFGASLFVDPYGWARVFRWETDPETDVGLYFGRCLGALAMASAVPAAMAVRDPARHRAFFPFFEAGCWFLAAVHVRGALERRQPAIETAEILGWSALAVGSRRYAPKALDAVTI